MCAVLETVDDATDVADGLQKKKIKTHNDWKMPQPTKVVKIPGVESQQ